MQLDDHAVGGPETETDEVTQTEFRSIAVTFRALCVMNKTRRQRTVADLPVMILQRREVHPPEFVTRLVSLTDTERITPDDLVDRPHGFVWQQAPDVWLGQEQPTHPRQCAVLEHHRHRDLPGLKTSPSH